MHIPIHTFADAPRWIRATLLLWRRKAIALSSTAMLFFFILMSVSILLQILLRGFGAQLAGLLIMPLLFMLLSQCRAFDQNIRPPNFGSLLATLKKQQLAFLITGLLYVFATELLGMLVIEPQRPALEPILAHMLAGEKTIEIDAKTSALIVRTAWHFLIGSTLIWALFAFLPTLLGHFHYSAGKSLFFALMAWARNWQALLAFALLFGVLLLAGFMLTAFLSALLPGDLGAIFFGLFILGVVVPLNVAAYYIVNREIFRPAAHENA